MKNLLFLFIAFFLLNQRKVDIISGDYIEIDYIGQNYVKPLIIYKEKSELGIIKQSLIKRFDSLKQVIPVERLLTEEEKKREVDSLFDFVITDKQTLKKIFNFIPTQHHLFTSFIKYEGYKIILPGKVYCISYTKKDEFFEKLKNYLMVQNCNKHVVERINVISKGP